MRKAKGSKKNTITKRLIIGLCAFALAGTIGIFATHAATPVNNAFEPESGSLSGNVTSAADANASNGTYVSFFAPVPTCPAGTTGTPPNCTTIPAGTVTIPNPGSWTNVTGTLSSVNDCDNWALLFAPPTSTKVYFSASCNHGGTGIYASTGSTSWTKLGSGSGSADPNTMAEQMVFDPSNVNNMWVSGIYGSGVSYSSTDGGTTMKVIDNGGHGHSDGIGVDLTDSNHQTIVIGRHESQAVAYKSTNGGQTFTDISSNLPSTSGFTEFPYVVNSSTFVMATFVSYSNNFGGQPGIYRTTNGGTSWTKQADFFTNSAPFVSGGVLYYTSAANGSDGVVRSSDNGVTWQHVGAGIKFESQVIGLPDGKLVALPGSGNRLIVSTDKGSTWTPFGAAMACDPRSVVYSPGQDAFYVSMPGCSSGDVQRLK